MKYTKKIHAEGLLIIFSETNTCGRCPSVEMKKVMGVALWDGESEELDAPQCDICWDFIGANRCQDGWGECPCYGRNQERAGKLTWLALEEKGYL